jgi:alkyl hydroperoxide reductase subunit AhpC
MPCLVADASLGLNLHIPLLADVRCACAYRRLVETKESRPREPFDRPKAKLWQITMNDLPVGRSTDEALRLVQAFQFTVSGLSYVCGVDGADVVRCGQRMSKAKYGLRTGRGGKTVRGDPSRNSIT